MILHIVSLRWTFHQSLKKILPLVLDTERTRNSRLKHVTLTLSQTCDLDLVSAWLSYEFCTTSHWSKYMTKVWRKSFQGYRRYGVDTKFKAQTHDLDLWPWVGMADLWVLHIHSLRRTFDQSLMKTFQRVREIWSGQESYGRTDRRRPFL